jgi:GAF domain
MRRRSRASSKVANARSPKAKTLRAARNSTSSLASQETEVAGLRRERDESRHQQKATAEILRVIRTSPADAQPVFEMIVRNAVSLCGSLHANVFRFDGELLHFVASHNVGRSHVDMLREKFPMRPDSSQVAGRAALKKEIIRLEDAFTDPDYDQRFARAMGFRRLLGVPMLREDDLLGVIVVGWAEAGPVPKFQEELLKTFADQAVIAIENARLLDELRQSLEQQTATSEVLRIISSSPGELEPVFQAMLENATRICDAKFGAMAYYRDGEFCPAALLNVPTALLRVHSTARVISSGYWKHLRTARPHETGNPSRGCRGGRVIFCEYCSQARRRTISDFRPNAKRGRVDRRNCYLPSGSSPLHRQADCTGAELRCASSDRYRECATAE